MPASAVDWLRPSELSDAPVLFGAGDRLGGVTQGSLCDRWFLNAVGILASQPKLLQELFVRTGQEAQVLHGPTPPALLYCCFAVLLFC